MNEERRQDYPNILAKLSVLDERTKHMLQDISGKDGIKEQCTKINGRMRSVETWRASVKGGFLVIAAILTGTIPTLVWLVLR